MVLYVFLKCFHKQNKYEGRYSRMTLTHKNDFWIKVLDTNKKENTVMINKFSVG